MSERKVWTMEEIEVLFPDAMVEIVDEAGRAEVVIYTGWSVSEFSANGYLVPMGDDDRRSSFSGGTR